MEADDWSRLGRSDLGATSSIRGALQGGIWFSGCRENTVFSSNIIANRAGNWAVVGNGASNYVRAVIDYILWGHCMAYAIVVNSDLQLR